MGSVTDIKYRMARAAMSFRKLSLCDFVRHGASFWNLAARRWQQRARLNPLGESSAVRWLAILRSAFWRADVPGAHIEPACHAAPLGRALGKGTQLFHHGDYSLPAFPVTLAE